jgi:hypothetical protein
MVANVVIGIIIVLGIAAILSAFGIGRIDNECGLKKNNTEGGPIGKGGAVQCSNIRERE